jgi:hypothetical protein
VIVAAAVVTALLRLAGLH